MLSIPSAVRAQEKLQMIMSQRIGGDNAAVVVRNDAYWITRNRDSVTSGNVIMDKVTSGNVLMGNVIMGNAMRDNVIMVDAMRSHSAARTGARSQRRAGSVNAAMQPEEGMMITRMRVDMGNAKDATITTSMHGKRRRRRVEEQDDLNHPGVLISQRLNEAIAAAAAGITVVILDLSNLGNTTMTTEAGTTTAAAAATMAIDLGTRLTNMRALTTTTVQTDQDPLVINSLMIKISRLNLTNCNCLKRVGCAPLLE